MTDIVESQAQSTEPQSARGRARLQRMLAAAAELFLRDGYDKTSIDAILVLSGGSKATLYAYFPTKEDLFRAVLDSVMVNNGQPTLDIRRDVREMLTEFAVDRLHVIFSTHHRAVLRLIIAERERFPDLARLYHERGPQRSHKLLVEYLTALKNAELLDVDDPDEAAEFFTGMLVHKWYKELLMLGAPTPSNSDLQERAEHVARRFIEAFHRRTH
ncbi:MAG TPA: TetR/AcrR family transcriptional regulator [Gammaproteobacteria bacterium]|nr:TetR/AcrR family transcriptional regulator [Gammaproteobacteria bacterium]